MTGEKSTPRSPEFRDRHPLPARVTKPGFNFFVDPAPTGVLYFRQVPPTRRIAKRLLTKFVCSLTGPANAAAAAAAAVAKLIMIIYVSYLLQVEYWRLDSLLLDKGHDDGMESLYIYVLRKQSLATGVSFLFFLSYMYPLSLARCQIRSA